MRTIILSIGVIGIVFSLGFSIGCHHPVKQDDAGAVQIAVITEDDEHTEIDEEMANMTCVECHQEYSPEVTENWFDSKHGMNNVKCFVCHGDLEETFVLHPKPDRCIGCHADQVSSLAHDSMAAKDCFSCHDGHILNPHKLFTQGGE